MARNRQSFRHPRVKPNYFHMSVGVGAAAIMSLFFFQLCRIFNGFSLISIAVFNFLFIFLLFPLEGSLFRKICLLVAGNIVGLAWHFIRLFFGAASVFYLGAGAFKIITVVVGPIIDFIWIVAVWSLGLSVLASSQGRNKGNGGDNN